MILLVAIEYITTFKIFSDHVIVCVEEAIAHLGFNFDHEFGEREIVVEFADGFLPVSESIVFHVDG